MTVKEIREELVSLGMSEKEAAEIKGKEKLLDKLKEVKENTTFEEVNDNPFVEGEVEENTIPEYTSPEWPAYVMSQFTKDELRDGNPKVTGLRRVALKLLGNIEDSGPVSSSSYSINDDPHLPPRAHVTFEVIFCDWLGYVGVRRRFCAVGGSFIGNTDDEFAAYPEGMAETRAEVRALRRALLLNTVSDDEITSNKDVKGVMKSYQPKVSDGEWEEGDSVTTQQINTIKKICERLKINVEKFINNGKNTYNNIEDIQRGTAAKMIARLNEYQSVGEESRKIPDEIMEN